MGYLGEILTKIFRGTAAGDETGTPARTAGQYINDNFDAVDNALEEINTNAEQKSNKVNNFSNPNNTNNYPSINAVEVRIDEKLGPYYNNTQTQPFTQAEKQKLQAIDAAHYGAPVQDLIALTAIPQSQITDKERRYVEDEGVDYFYDVQMTTPGENDVAPDDQQNSTGFWRRTQIGGESATSVKTKYESNPDTNAFTDSHKTKVEGLPATVESVSGAQTKADTAEANAIAYSDANRADLEVQISDVEDSAAENALDIADILTLITPENKTGTSLQFHKPIIDTYNYASPSAATAYTLGLPAGQTKKVNSGVRCFINAPSKPSFTNNTGSGTITEKQLDDFTADTNMEMIVECPNGIDFEVRFRLIPDAA